MSSTESPFATMRLPLGMVRLPLKLALGLHYRVRGRGLHHLPTHRGVLLLGNRVSWLDGILLQIALPRRLRFAVDAERYRRRSFRWLWRWIGAIPVADTDSTEAFDRIAACLDDGEVVCFFPEGRISETTQLGSFQGGFEQAAARSSTGVIVPFYLHGMGGSRSSGAHQGVRQRRRAGLLRQVVVNLGAPLNLDSSAAAVRQAVSELSVAAWQDEPVQPLPVTWLKQARRRPFTPAVADSTGGWLRNIKLVTATIGLAGHIRRHVDGQRIGILLPPGTAGLIANLASLLAGKTVVNLNYTAEPAAVRAAIDAAGIQDVITAARFTNRLAERGFDSEGLLGGTRRLDMETFRDDFTRSRRLLALTAACLVPARPLARWMGGRQDPENTAAVLFSSGSEGTPKGVELSHRNILANTRQVTETIDVRTDDTVLGNLPLFHAFGLTVTTFLPALEGVPVAAYPDATDALGNARTIACHGVTVMCSTSSFLRLFARNPRIHPAMLDSIRYVVAGAERLDPAVREQFQQRFLKAVYEGYGTTETAPVVAANVPDRVDTKQQTIRENNRHGTVGRPMPGTACRIADPETNQCRGTDADGMVLVAGPQVMKGYLAEPERTAEAVVTLDGYRWYRTGDMGRLDEDGFLTIVDRYARFAKISGEMISLTRVEAALREVILEPEVEITAVNLPDSRKGERIVLLVAMHEDIERIQQAIKESTVHGMMKPSAVHAVEALPRLGTGKLDFKGAKELAREREGE